jgi:hypothetical protein
LLMIFAHMLHLMPVSFFVHLGFVAIGQSLEFEHERGFGDTSDSAIGSDTILPSYRQAKSSLASLLAARSNPSMLLRSTPQRRSESAQSQLETTLGLRGGSLTSFAPSLQTEDDFMAILQESNPRTLVLLLFDAEGHPPSLEVELITRAIVKEHPGVKLFKVPVPFAQDVIEAASVKTAPAVLGYKNGEIVGRLSLADFPLSDQDPLDEFKGALRRMVGKFATHPVVAGFRRILATGRKCPAPLTFAAALAYLYKNAIERDEYGM